MCTAAMNLGRLSVSPVMWEYSTGSQKLKCIPEKNKDFSSSLSLSLVQFQLDVFPINVSLKAIPVPRPQDLCLRMRLHYSKST